MDSVITINNLKDSTIEFDIETTGFDKNVDLSARLVISASPVLLAFNCEQEAGKWICKIPAMSYLTPSAYPFTIEVVIDGYFFEALRGTVNIAATKDVYITIPTSARTIEPQSAPEEEEEAPIKPAIPKPKEIEVTVTPTEVKDDKQATPKNNKDVADLAKKIMADVERNESKEEPEKKKKEVAAKKEEKKEEVSEAQKRAIIVKEILDAVITGRKPKTKFSIRDTFTS